MKKYMDIERLKDKYVSAFIEGEHITITEKIDGANASIRYNPETDEVQCFSRRNELSPSLTLEGFWNYVQTLDKDIIKCATDNGRYIIFGEWLVRHSIRYPEDKMKKFYMFDLYDTETETYTKWEQVKKVAEFVGLTTVPIFYDGKFTTWDDVYSYLGKSEMCGEPSGEGIVVKSQDRLDNKNSRTPCYVKIVTKEFSEVHKSKPHKEIDPEKVAQEQRMLELVATVVTPRRVEKTIQKFIDDELIPRDWNEHNLADLSKILPKAVCQDCVKEEKETVIKVEKFGKYCAKLCMQYARDMIK